jgi:hypothetical protein
LIIEERLTEAKKKLSLHLRQILLKPDCCLRFAKRNRADTHMMSHWTEVRELEEALVVAPDCTVMEALGQAALAVLRQPEA